MVIDRTGLRSLGARRKQEPKRISEPLKGLGRDLETFVAKSEENILPESESNVNF